MKTERRWIESVIVAANEEEVILPWQRQNRVRPAAFRAEAQAEVPARAIYAVAAR